MLYVKCRGLALPSSEQEKRCSEVQVSELAFAETALHRSRVHYSMLKGFNTGLEYERDSNTGCDGPEVKMRCGGRCLLTGLQAASDWQLRFENGAKSEGAAVQQLEFLARDLDRSCCLIHSATATRRLKLFYVNGEYDLNSRMVAA